MKVDKILPQKQIAIIENSFTEIEERSFEFAISFYDNLFKDCPQLKSLFTNANMTDQYQKLVENLSYVVKNLSHPILLTNAVKSMGVKHASYGVLPEHYPRFGNAFLKTLKTHFQTKWSPEVEAAWTAAYTAIAYLMLEAAERASDAVIADERDPKFSDEPQPIKLKTNHFLSSEDIDALEDSFILIRENSTNFTATFYELLFTDHPQTKEALGKIDLAAREKKFIETLFSAIETIRNPSLFNKEIDRVKTVYDNLGVLPDHYAIVGKTLLRSLKFYLGAGWTPQVESAWTSLSEFMVKQLSQTAPKENPKPEIKPKNPTPKAPKEELTTDRFDRGEEKLNQIYNRASDRLTKSLKDIAPDLSRYIIEYGYGEIYCRPGLDLKSRQIAAISALVVLGNAESQLMDNIHGALNVGCTETEIVETILQMSLFTGFPPVLRALEVAKIVFAERD